MVEGEELIEPPRVCAHDVDAVHAKFAEVVGELFRARRAHLARGDMRRAACEGGNLGGLAARCGAHIEDIGTTACGKGERRKHRGKALQIDLTFLIELKLPYRFLAHAIAQHERVFIPWNAFERNAPLGKLFRHFAWRRLKGIGAQGDGASCGGRKPSLDAFGILVAHSCICLGDELRRAGQWLGG